MGNSEVGMGNSAIEVGCKTAVLYKKAFKLVCRPESSAGHRARFIQVGTVADPTFCMFSAFRIPTSAFPFTVASIWFRNNLLKK